MAAASGGERCADFGIDADYRWLAEELGATWLLTAYRMDLDELGGGPPT